MRKAIYMNPPRAGDPNYATLVHRVINDLNEIGTRQNVPVPDISDLESTLLSGQTLPQALTQQWFEAQHLINNLGNDEQRADLNQLLAEYRILSSLTSPSAGGEILVHPLFRPQINAASAGIPFTLIVADFRSEKATIQVNIPVAQNPVLIDSRRPDFQSQGGDSEFLFFEAGNVFYMVIAPEVEDEGIVPTEEMAEFFYGREAPQFSSFSTAETPVVMGLWASTLAARSALEQLGFYGRPAVVSKIQFVAAQPDGKQFIYPETPYNGLAIDLVEENGWDFLIQKINPSHFTSFNLNRSVSGSKEIAERAYENFKTIVQTLRRGGMWMDEHGWSSLSVFLGERLEADDEDPEVNPGDVKIDVTSVPHILRAHEFKTAVDDLKRIGTPYYFPNIAAISTGDLDIIEAERMVMLIQDMFRETLGLGAPSADEVTVEAMTEFERYLQLNDMQYHLQLTENWRQNTEKIVRYYYRKLGTEGLETFVGLALFPILFKNEGAASFDVAKKHIDEAARLAQEGQSPSSYWKDVESGLWPDESDLQSGGRNGNGSPNPAGAPPQGGQTDFGGMDGFSAVNSQGLVEPQAAQAWGGLIYTDVLKPAEFMRIAP